MSNFQSNQFSNIFQVPQGAIIHLSGIAGCAMSNLAIILRQHGFTLRGTDIQINNETYSLFQSMNIEVSTHQDGSFISKETVLVIASAAVSYDGDELKTAFNMKIPVIKYAQALGMIMNSFKGIAIAGTHGKTTTTALLVSAFKAANVHPGFVIGGQVPQFKIEDNLQNSEIFVAEACEYDRSFLNLYPQVAVITNIETDHLDIYADFEEIKKTFALFIQNIKPGGHLVYCIDDENTRLMVGSNSNSISYGIKEGADYQAVNIEASPHQTTFNVKYKDTISNLVKLTIPGLHNVRNSIAAFACGVISGADPEKLICGINSFHGVKRRFEFVGSKNDIVVIDDYAHHPTEIKALLQGARQKYPSRRVVVIFQPHQISRTEALFDDFAQSFDRADLVLICDIYAAREQGKKLTTTSFQLAYEIEKHGTFARHIPNCHTNISQICSFLNKDDVCITVGAGDVFKLGPKILETLSL